MKSILRHLPILFTVIGIMGCSTEYNLATRQEETLIYGTQKEIQIGDAVAQQLEEHYRDKIITDVDVNLRLQEMLDKIVAVCDRKELRYSIKAIDEDMVNAVSLPGGYVYIFKGLLDKVKSDDQLAGVIAHEVGHITARHAIKRLQAMYGYTLLQVLSIATGDIQAVQGTQAIFSTAFLSYAQGDELQSDQLGVKYLKKAGYDPYGMLEVLEILEKEQQKAPLQPVSYFRTHPHVPERKAVVNQEITGQLDFKGYLNITGE